MLSVAAPRRDLSVGWSLGHSRGVPDGDGWLTDTEREAQKRFTVPKRRADWRLGRWTAKGAVTAWLGTSPTTRSAVGIAARGPDDGFPLVEGAGSPAPSISLTHRESLAAAVVGPSGVALGCDLERIEPRSRAFVADWFTGAEQQTVDTAAPERRDGLVALTWSAKESALKAMGEGLRVDTRCVEATLLGDEAGAGAWRRLRVAAPEGARFEGWWRMAEGLVLVVVADQGALRCPPRRLWPADESSEDRERG